MTLPDGRRVGELDEEMVYEARAGQAFLLGASTWRIEEITRDRVIVTPAPGAPGAVPFWKGDSVGRPKELGEAIGAFSRWAVEQDEQTLERDYDLDRRAAANLLAYLREQQQATRVLPSERTIVLERFRDEIGDWRLCVLSPFGGRVHAAWGLALSARMHERFGLDSDPIWTDDGIIMHLPDLDSEEAEALPSAAELLLLDPDEVEAAIVSELGSSALFGARFRENAARALLIPRAYPGRRTPLWQQRLKAQNLLEVARRYEQFPIILETYRECLKDVLDLPGLQSLLRGLHTREISLVEVETQHASPFASSLLFDYVASYMYEGDTPSAERRAAALSLDRDLLRELLGQEELRELIDPEALERMEADLQCRSEMTRATGRDGLHDVLRRVGDLTAAELAERVFAGVDAQALLGELRRERRAVELRVGGESRLIAADEAGLYRDALGRLRQAGCRPPSSQRSRMPCASWWPAMPVPTDPSRLPICTPATASTLPPSCASSSATESWCGGSCAPVVAGATGVTWRSFGACAAPRLPLCARRSSPPRRAALPPSCPPGRGSTATPPPAPASTACARCSCRCRAWRCPLRAGSATSCRGARAPTRRPGSTISAPAASWSGSARVRSALGARGALLPRRRRRHRPTARQGRGGVGAGARARAAARAPGAGPLLLHRPAGGDRCPAGGAARGPLGSRLGR